MGPILWATAPQQCEAPKTRYTPTLYAGAHYNVHNGDFQDVTKTSRRDAHDLAIQKLLMLRSIGLGKLQLVIEAFRA